MTTSPCASWSSSTGMLCPANKYRSSRLSKWKFFNEISNIQYVWGATIKNKRKNFTLCVKLWGRWVAKFGVWTSQWFLELMRVKKRTFFGQLDFQCWESPEISVKLGEGGSRFFSELHTKCGVFAVIFYGCSPIYNTIYRGCLEMIVK